MSVSPAVFAVGAGVAVVSKLAGVNASAALALGVVTAGAAFAVTQHLTQTKVEEAPVRKGPKRKVNKKKVEREAKEAAQAAQQAAAPTRQAAPVKAVVTEDEPLTAAQKKKNKKKAAKAANKAVEAAAAKAKGEAPPLTAKQAKKAKKAQEAEEQAKDDAKLKRKKDKLLKKQLKVMESEGGWEQVPTKSKVRKAQVQEGSGDEGAAPAHSINIIVDPKHYGLIIGPAAATLTKLMEGTTTTIDVPKKGLARQHITIAGNPANCEAAKQAIIQLTTKGYSDVTHAGTVDEGIEVPSRALGAVIGPGGANIKAIQAKTGTRINVPDRGADSNRVSIVGDADGVEAAQIAIKQLIDEGYSTLTHENYVKSVLEIPGECVRALIGTRGETIRDLQKSTTTRIKVPSDDTSAFVSVIIVGEADNVSEARTKITALLKPPEPIPTPPEWQQENTVPADPWDED